MRIIGGAWRGRVLRAADGPSTRPTADRVRQALFDRLMHAPWALNDAGRPVLEGALVLDAFAGTGALGLEAMSRGAVRAVFIERDRSALAALRANIAACGAQARSRVIAGDALRPPPGEACGLVFLDPPYGAVSLTQALAALAGAGWVGPTTLCVTETADSDVPHDPSPALATFSHGPARIQVFTFAR